MVLVAAWGLLAVVGLAQLVLPDRSDDPDQRNDTNLAYSDPESDPDTGSDTATDSEAGAGEGSVGGVGRSGDRTLGIGPADDQPDLGQAPIADPAGWREVKIELDPEAYVATVKSSDAPGHGVASFGQPAQGAVQHWFPSPTQFGGDRVFLVLDQTSSDDFIKVSLPVMPNGQDGWIARDQVEITKVEHRAMIDLSMHSLTVWDGDGMVTSTKAVTGRPTTPTPLGTFYVRDIVAQDDPDGQFGPYVLALSGFSEVLETFDGGLPALAIHGTDRPDQVGRELSAGCIRIPNDLITMLAESVPLGTPVTVVA
jgi:hypothetical protein